MQSLTAQQALDLAMQHHRAGRLSDAENIYRQILAAQPNHPDALHMLGVVALQVGNFQVAVDLISRAIAVNPNMAGYQSNLGLALTRLGRFVQAADAIEQSIRLNPNLTEAYCNLGDARLLAGQIEPAVAAYRSAIRLAPRRAVAHAGLGNALQAQEDFAGAIECYRQAISLDPNVADTWNNLTNALRRTKQVEQAIQAAQTAIRLKPDLAEAHANLGLCYRDQRRIDEAIDAFSAALRINPRQETTHNELGNAYKERAQLDEAIACYRRAMEINPKYSAAHSNLIYAMHFHPGIDAGMILEEARKWDRALGRGEKETRGRGEMRAGRKLRVGYVSADFRDHVVGRNLLPLFRHRDRDRFEVTCYATARMSDHVTDDFRSHSDHFCDLSSLTPQTAAQRVREDGIDILVDLSLHMGGTFLPMFALKPAPVQATFAGYPGTTGLSAIDFRLTDPYLDPPENDPFYSERSIRLPSTFWCYEAFADAAPEVSPPPLDRNGFVTFGCLNNFCKVNERVLELWASVLAEMPGSKMVLLAPEGESRRRTLAAFSRFGIDSARIEFVDIQPRNQYLKVYQKIDISLDTFPYNGHTTSLDSLWMGVPTVTLVGQLAVARAGFSQLSNLGLTELIAKTPQEYLQIAASLADDPRRLVQLRTTLRQTMQSSPLMDGRLFAANVENALRTMLEKDFE
jgi:predicted O-linked N-acetylglucosamine transferase (SPINDLY family)